MNSNIPIFLYLFLNCDIVVLDISILLQTREESRQIETIGEEQSVMHCQQASLAFFLCIVGFCC